ncbi:hypothetical protein HY488_02750 [Candidatus Woesearchaeota archaeon]|nr:hypothetical protein [Candidatus Woesearchaeota archaeon]
MKFYSVALPKRAQSSLEFAVLIGMFMIMFVVFFYVLSDRMLAFHEQRNARAANDIIYKVQNEFNLALKVHDGYNRTFWLPLELYGREYAIQLAPLAPDVPREIQVEYVNHTYVAPILINLTLGSQVVKGKNRIEKYMNNITISPD